MSARVGIDLGQASPHTAVGVYADGRTTKPVGIEMSVDGIEKLVRLSKEVGGGELSEVVMEATGNQWLLLAAHLKSRGIEVVIGSTKKVSDLRKFYYRHCKTDPGDAQTAARLPDVDPRGSHRYEMPAVDVLTLRRLVKEREILVRDAGTYKQRIHAVAQLANPKLMEVLGDDKFSIAGRVMLGENLNPFTVVKHGEKRLAQIMKRRGARLSEERVKEIYDACQKTCELNMCLKEQGKLPFHYDQLCEEAKTYLDIVELLDSKVSQIERDIADTYKLVDPTGLLTSLPGFGETISPAIEALSSPILRFHNMRAYTSYCGLVPRRSQSGFSDHKNMPITKSGHRLLRKYFYLAADVARRVDPELANYYICHKEKGWHHNRILVAIAHKLARRVYALLHRRDAHASDQHRDSTPIAFQLRTPDGKPVDKKSAQEFIAQRKQLALDSSLANKQKTNGTENGKAKMRGSTKAPPKGLKPNPSLSRSYKYTSDFSRPSP